MIKKLVIGLIMIFLLTIISLSVYTAPNDLGCCLNPLATDYYCASDQIKESDCCPDNTYYPSFYYDDTAHPYGPQTQEECVTDPSENGFFSAGTTCLGYTAQCTIACCCPGNFPDSDPFETEKGICIAQGGTPYEVADCNANACGGVPQPNVTNPSCSSPSYVPSIGNVNIKPVKGEKRITLTWTDTCKATSYKITRCLDNNCVVIGQPETRSFTDDTVELWDTTYNYKIEGTYEIQGFVSSSNTYPGNLGNIECWGKTDRDKFCMYLKKYKQTNIKQYLIDNDPTITEGNYDNAVNSIYEEKINNAYRCNDFNLLSDPPMKVCSEDTICFIEDGEAQCSEESLCQPDFSNSPFGLYSTKQECYDTGYCYWDTSKTLVDKCYSCNGGMSCYDYKSKSACEEDICGTAIGNCIWKDLLSEVGTGVCIDNNEDNCDWCDKAGTTDTDTTGYNSVLASCTEQKAQALSTLGFQCYFANGKANSCSAVSCLSLSSEDCPDTQPQLDKDNSVLGSLGICDIGVCQQFGNECRKNANADTAPDCVADKQACEKDYFPPDTYITLIEDEGITIGLDITITDRSTNSNLYNPEDYKTWLCIEAQGTSTCSTKKGTDYGLFTIDKKLSINGLLLSDWNYDRTITLLSEGLNTIYYYTEDLSKNLGIVKTIQVEAHKDNTRPELYRVEIENGREKDGILYSNIPKPWIKLYFRQPGAQLFAGTKLRNSNNIDIVEFNEFIITPIASPNTTNYTLTLPNTTNLSGTYKLGIAARNSNNILLALSQREKTIKISSTPSQATITPPPPDLFSDSLINLNIQFPNLVNLDWFTISGENFLNEFPQQDNDFSTVFTKTLNLSDGTKRINIGGKDIYGNEASGYSEFTINSHPPQIGSLKIISPSYGVTPTNTFNLTLQSENDIECRYTIDDPPPATSTNNFFQIMAQFDSTSSSTHIKESLTLTDENLHKLYVLCKDTTWRPEPYKFEFDLKVDTSPPTITDLHTLPENPIAEIPVNLTLTAVANEEVICRYSEENKPYVEMENKFNDLSEEDFKTRKRAYIDINQEASYTYHTACENKAGLISQIRPITLNVDTSIPLQITDHTEDYQGISTPTLAIQTNKKAFCWYSFVQNAPGNLIGLTTQDSYAHTATLYALNLSSSSYNVYVRCRKGEESKQITVNFVIDLTPPSIQYVNDSSLLDLKPEITPYQDRIYVTWYAIDNESGNRGISYNYSLIEAISQDTIIPWTSGEDLSYDDNVFDGWISEANGEDLNLSDNTKYKFKLKAGNVVKHWSDIKESDGVTTDFSLLTNNTCSNDIKDSTESDIDCGGICGSTCEIDDECNKDRDCRSDYCSEDDICKDPTCTDEVENSDETDVDCGGDDCDECEEGDSCKENSDCETGFCSKFNVCKKADSCSDGKLGAGESDIDCGGICPVSCTEGQYCDVDPDCASGLVCVAGVCEIPDIELDVDSDGDGIPDTWEKQNNLDPDDPSDGNLDFDGDGLTNYNEYLYGTNPNREDTDGDGHNDKKEVDKGTDTTDPNDKPGGILKIFLIVLLVLIILGGIGYVLYIRYYQKKQPPPAQPEPYQKPVQKARKPFMLIKRPKIKKKRRSLLEAFGTKEEDKKTELKKEPQRYINISELKKPKDDVFKKLSTIIDKKKDKPKLETKKDTVIDSKLDKIEKKVAEITKPKKVYATATGKKFHNPDCITLKKVPKSKLRIFKDSTEAEKNKLTSCTVCKK